MSVQLVAIFVLAFLVESMTEYFLAPWEGLKPYLKYAAAAVGVGLAVAYKVDLLKLFLELESTVPVAGPYIGQVLTGLIMGRGANFVHDVWSKITEFRQ